MTEEELKQQEEEEIKQQEMAYEPAIDYEPEEDDMEMYDDDSNSWMDDPEDRWNID